MRIAELNWNKLINQNILGYRKINLIFGRIICSSFIKRIQLGVSRLTTSGVCSSLQLSIKVAREVTRQKCDKESQVSKSDKGMCPKERSSSFHPHLSNLWFEIYAYDYINYTNRVSTRLHEICFPTL